ncbi:MAG: hypothetical protein WCQ21_37395, partial [Verrucomicrobiota bacterium]
PSNFVHNSILGKGLARKPYIVEVVSLIEARSVSRTEILEMLQKVLRQHSPPSAGKLIILSPGCMKILRYYRRYGSGR